MPPGETCHLVKPAPELIFAHKLLHKLHIFAFLYLYLVAFHRGTSQRASGGEHQEGRPGQDTRRGLGVGAGGRGQGCTGIRKPRDRSIK